jgi:hypothetical protein
VNATTASLRHHERELFRENRFLGLPHGLAAAGPAILAMFCCLRLSMAYQDCLTWLCVGVVYAIAYGILVVRLPRRQFLKALAHRRYDEETSVGSQLELSFDRADFLELDESLQRLLATPLNDVVTVRRMRVAGS